MDLKEWKYYTDVGATYRIPRQTKGFSKSAQNSKNTQALRSPMLNNLRLKPPQASSLVAP